MNISNKVEEIRRQPESVRLRWAWSLTAVSMLAVLFVWFLSVKIQGLDQEKKELTTPEQQAFLDEFQTQKKSLGETAEEFKDAYNSSLNAQLPGAPDDIRDDTVRNDEAELSGEGFGR
jgi:hypothetical protein